MALKLNEQGYDILKDELTKCEGPFSKTQNVMLALDLMAKGEELSSTQVTMAHLSNIIKLLCVKLRWNEEPLEVKNEETNDSGEYTEKNEEVEKNSSHVSNVMKNSEKLCRFYKRGQCKYGKSGKTENTGSHISVTINDGKTYVSQVLKEYPVALFLMIFTGSLSLGNNYTPSIRGCL